MRRNASVLFAASLAVLAACDSPGRPLPPEVTADVQLQVEVVAPVTNQLLLIGDTARILVRAHEPAGHLRGIGFVARRPGRLLPALDSVVVRFAAVADTTVEFELPLPATLPSDIQVDIFGLAFGPEPRDAVSEPQHVFVMACPPNAVWC